MQDRQTERFGKIKFSIGNEIKVLEGFISEDSYRYIIRESSGRLTYVPKSQSIVSFLSEVISK